MVRWWVIIEHPCTSMRNLTNTYLVVKCGRVWEETHLVVRKMPIKTLRLDVLVTNDISLSEGIGYSVVTAVSGGLLLELSLYLDFGLLDSIHRR